MDQSIIHVGAGALIIKDGKILMTKRRGALGEGSYGTVGGHVEWGEHPIETVRREAYEELGIRVSELKVSRLRQRFKIRTSLR